MVRIVARDPKGRSRTRLYEEFREFLTPTEARQYAKSGAQFARKLGQLARLDAWETRIEKEDSRIGANRQKQTIWTIRKSIQVKNG